MNVALRVDHCTTPSFENTAAQRSLDSSTKRRALARIETSYSFAICHGTSSETGETSQRLRSKKSGRSTALPNAFEPISYTCCGSRAPLRSHFGLHIIVGDRDGCFFRK